MDALTPSHRRYIRPLILDEASDREINSWVSDDQRIPFAVSFVFLLFALACFSMTFGMNARVLEIAHHVGFLSWSEDTCAADILISKAAVKYRLLSVSRFARCQRLCRRL